MSALRHEVQREVFANSGERVVAVCEVHKPYKKKKTSVLCVVRGPTFNDAHVVQVSRAPWRRKRTWPISEVHSVDVPSDSNSTILELMADKLYSWVCVGAEERREWLRALTAAAPISAPAPVAPRPAHIHENDNPAPARVFRVPSQNGRMGILIAVADLQICC
ncbi:hypothetical protein EVAR_54220_1 [Eumeta japonica]|uniref:Exocyst complex component Sec3 PIP2-binding N-terminal domain-containing protein n=1 Tax=Eumeta variegata TaxID=151549 RepID=A0A4C1Z2E5_EUMVA|nr:hypothetical protein EVAR_54220_1 [Eumeta japonica]